MARFSGGGELLNVKCVFWFSLQRLSETVFILRKIQRDIIIKAYWSARKVPVIFCRVLIKAEFSRQIFRKFSNIKFHENPSSGSRLIPWGRTDRQTDITRLTDAFRNFANAPNKDKWYLKWLCLQQCTLRRYQRNAFYHHLHRRWRPNVTPKR
jgi:hypothetical protein